MISTAQITKNKDFFSQKYVFIRLKLNEIFLNKQRKNVKVFNRLNLLKMVFIIEMALTYCVGGKNFSETINGITYGKINPKTRIVC